MVIGNVNQLNKSQPTFGMITCKTNGFAICDGMLKKFYDFLATGPEIVFWRS